MQRPVRLLLLLVAVLACAPCVAFAAPAAAPDDTWGVDGTVYATAAIGDHIFLGGSFYYIGPPTGTAIGLNATTGALPASSAYPQIAGEVDALAPDGNGGFYAGGSFYRARGTNVDGLVHIKPDGTLDTAFNPPAPSNAVDTLLLAGNRLYVGGRFDQMGTTPRANLAAVDATTGALSSWTADTDDDVDALALSPTGRTLYVAGDFDTLAGKARTSLGAVSTSTGAATSFAPQITSTGGNYGLTVAATSTAVYVGGSFDHAGGAVRNDAAAFDPSTGAVTSWDPNPDFTVDQIVSGGGRLFVAGAFTHLGGASTGHLVSVSPTTGAPLGSFAPPSLSGHVAVALSPDASTLYGTSEDTVGGNRGLFALDAASGTQKTAFKSAIGCPYCSANVLATSAGKVFVAGNTRSYGGLLRRNLAAIDATTGQADPSFASGGWPDRVEAMTSAGSTLALAADGAVAGLAPSDGHQLWTTPFDADVDALTATSSRLYAGGYFTKANNAAHATLAALDPSTGAVDSAFNASTGAATGDRPNVYALAAGPSALYVGGEFTKLGSGAHANIGAVDLTTGAVKSSFTGAADDRVTSLAADSSHLFAGGQFSSPAAHLASLNPTTGALASGFSAPATGDVDTLALVGNVLGAGGAFDTISGADRNGLAAVNATSGAVLAGPANVVTNDNAGGDVLGMTGSAGRLIVGGGFDEAGGALRTGLAVFSDPVAYSLVAPAISGTPRADATLTCSPGSWTSHPTSYLYAWLRDGSAIGGQTAATYKVTDADVTHKLSCRVTAKTAAGSSTPATSAEVTALPGVPANTAAPAIDTDVHVGKAVTCSNGTWTRSPTSYSRTWTIDGATVSGARGTTYTPADSDQGKSLRCVVVAKNAGGSSAPAQSNASKVGATLVPVILTAPSIGSEAHAGSPVTCTNGDWTNTPTRFTRQWTLDATVISGATGAQFTPKPGDQGHSLRCVVTASNAYGASKSAPSNALTVQAPYTPPVVHAGPTISSDGADAATLTCSTGAWTPAPDRYAYQWSRDGVALAAQTRSTYAGTLDDRGHSFTCTVTAYAHELAGKPATSGVFLIPAPPGPPVNTALPVISSDGATLTCSTGTWTGADPSGYEYQWYDTSGSPISGATTNTYKVSGDALLHGGAFQCRVTANGAGGTASARSDAYGFDGKCDTDNKTAGGKPIIIPGCAGSSSGGGGATSGGGGSTSSTPPLSTRLAACAGAKSTTPLNDIAVTGCSTRSGDSDVYSGNLSINGVDLQPVLSKGTLSVAKSASASDDGTITSKDSPYRVFMGPILIYQGNIDWKVPKSAGKTSIDIAKFNPPEDANVEGFPMLNGKAGTDHGAGEGIALSADGNHEMSASVALELPLAASTAAQFLDIDDLTGEATLHTTPADGLTHDKIAFTKDDLLDIGVLSIGPVTVSYDPTADVWSGSVDAELSLEAKDYEAQVGLTFKHGSFKGATLAVKQLNIPIAPAVFLDELRGGFSLDPLTISAGASISAGPEVKGESLVNIDGNVKYTDGTPATFHADGTAKLAGIPLESGYADISTDGFFDFGMSLDVGLPDVTQPKTQPLYLSAGLEGWFYGSQFNVEGHIEAGIRPLDLSIGADGLISSKGVAGCADLDFVSVGFSYEWATHDLEGFWHGCDVGTMRVQRPANHPAPTSGGGDDRAYLAQAGNAYTFDSDQTRWIELDGVAHPPVPLLLGPGGQRITAQALGTAPIHNDQYVVLEDTSTNRTYVAIHHPKGTWAITPQPGSSAITAVKAADVLATPTVTGKVTGKGTRRTLTYAVHGTRPGQRVVLAEKTKEGTVPITTTPKTAGSVDFTTAQGPAGTHRIVATVLEDGFGRRSVAVASFRAPARRTPGRVKSVRVTRKGTSLRLSWPSLGKRVRYQVAVKGKGIAVKPRTHAHRLTVPNIPAGLKTVKVTVYGVRFDGHRGAGRSVTVRVARKTKAKRRH